MTGAGRHRIVEGALGALLWTATLACAQPVLQQSQQTEPNENQLVLQGRLTQVFAIGGETTGWALQLDEDIEFDGARVSSIELDPAPRGHQLDGLNDRRVRVTGALEWREGVERGRYRVLVMETVQELE